MNGEEKIGKESEEEMKERGDREREYMRRTGDSRRKRKGENVKMNKGIGWREDRMEK